MKTLVVGCGRRPKLGAINLDKFDLPGVDLVFDLDRIESSRTRVLLANKGKAENFEETGDNFYVSALPFPNNYFERIEAEDVLEHVKDIVAVVQELGRVLKPGGTLWIRGPHCNYPEQVWADPTHKRAFAPRSFDNWDPETYDGKHYGHYFGVVKFKVVSVIEKNKGLEFTLIKRAPDGSVPLAGVEIPA